MVALTEGVGTAGNTDLRATPSIQELLLRIQGEYHEMPGLSLTAPQAERLWGLDSPTCAVVMTTLIGRRILRRTALGTYVLGRAG
jgi:hypothetical protein